MFSSTGRAKNGRPVEVLWKKVYGWGEMQAEGAGWRPGCVGWLSWEGRLLGGVAKLGRVARLGGGGLRRGEVAAYGGPAAGGEVGRGNHEVDHAGHLLQHLIV